jgi:hypothetical protein
MRLSSTNPRRAGGGVSVPKTVSAIMKFPRLEGSSIT